MCDENKFYADTKNIMISENKPLIQIGIAASFAVFGLILIQLGLIQNLYITAAIGGVLLLITVFFLTQITKETIILSKTLRNITVEAKSLFRRKKEIIDLDNIKSVKIELFGKPGTFYSFYYLNINTLEDKSIQLFQPKMIYTEMYKRENAEKWQTKINTMMKKPK